MVQVEGVISVVLTIFCAEDDDQKYVPNLRFSTRGDERDDAPTIRTLTGFYVP